ncbi:hypothetical protein NLI96_g11825 [Meripilus lineatus]|uniref:Uncharacterized protein n=1 Tax=Meripilus lineatus TaxID=2056292 RepID=A0AAD5Y845_9APHY|nr:hypothetical protein NLI96_g11825 [Physisporinus lineatus]
MRPTVLTANAAQKGNLVGPLASAETFVHFTVTFRSIGIFSRRLFESPYLFAFLFHKGSVCPRPIPGDRTSPIRFSFMIPSTVEGDFRASALDGGIVREGNPHNHGLEREAFGKRCITSSEKIIMIPRLSPAATTPPIGSSPISSNV